MVKFYVYTSEQDKLEFVEDAHIEQFAAYEFKPEVMKFSGVAIEAKELGDAMKVYQSPSCNCGEYMMADEPTETFTRRQMSETRNDLEKSFNETKFKLEYLRCIVKMKQASTYLHMASRLIQDVSTDLHRMYNAPTHLTPPEIFDQLSQCAIQATIKFNGDTKKSG